MKRSIGFIIFVVGLGVLAHAQTPDTTGQPGKMLSPTRQAAHQLKMLQNQLNLDEDQVTQLQVILINRDVALDSIRNNPSGDAKADGRSRREINHLRALLADPRGSGADRQIAVFEQTGSIQAVIRFLMQQTLQGFALEQAERSLA